MLPQEGEESQEEDRGWPMGRCDPVGTSEFDLPVSEREALNVRPWSPSWLLPSFPLQWLRLRHILTGSKNGDYSKVGTFFCQFIMGAERARVQL